MTVSELLRTLRQRGVEFEASGDRLRFRPREAVTDDLRAELLRHKPELLRLLAGQPVTVHDCHAAFEHAVAEANRHYRGGPIDWPAVDTAAALIADARTLGELETAVRFYVAAVADEYGWALGAFALSPME